MTPDQVLQQVFDKIPDRDQTVLRSQHGITDLSKLRDKKLQLQQRQLKDVCSDVQMVLETVCTYLDSLGSVSSFTWEGLENFCGYDDNSGDYVFDSAEEVKKMKKDTKQDIDPDGYNLTSEERRQMEQLTENDPLALKVRGFSSRSMQFETDYVNKKTLIEDPSEKTVVAFNGSVFYVNNCYYHQQENGENVIVGIKTFTRNEKKAIVALVVPFNETIMGPGSGQLEEEPPVGVPATYEEDQNGLPLHVQVYEKPGYEPIVPLSSLKPCMEPSKMPELMFERQQDGQPPHNFGFVYDHDGKNRGEKRDENIRFIDLFAGSGGFHQGVTQVQGFEGAAAVEWWDTACQTFKKNHPETPVYCKKVEDFLEESGPTPVDFAKKHGQVLAVFCSPPCQSFSGSNRNVDHNGEKDLYRKNLSLKFFDAMQTSGALMGVFENVEGMWRRPNAYFLKKIVLDHLRAGYQVRVRLHYAQEFGDPQKRPRLIIYVARKFVEMANVVETHGSGKHPYVTVGNAFMALDKKLEKIRQNPDMAPLPNLGGSCMQQPGSDNDKDILDANKPAGTIRCGGRAWHPVENRVINIREAATLQSYPYHYEFLGSLTDQYKQVGNAVPGRMARAIAMALKESLSFVYKEEEEEDETNNGADMDMQDAEKEDAPITDELDKDMQGDAEKEDVPMGEETENTPVNASM